MPCTSGLIGAEQQNDIKRICNRNLIDEIVGTLVDLGFQGCRRLKFRFTSSTYFRSFLRLILLANEKCLKRC